MKDLIDVIFAAPVASLFMVAGFVFLLIAVVGNIAGKIEPGKAGRIASGAIGAILLVMGLGLHFTAAKVGEHAEKDRKAGEARELADADARKKQDEARQRAEKEAAALAKRKAPEGQPQKDRVGEEAGPRPEEGSRAQAKTSSKAAEPTVLRRSAFRNALHVGASLHFYDFDKPEQLANPTSTVDFFFKPDSNDRATTIGVVPYNGAKFAPRSADLVPWEMDQSKLSSAQGVYSVPQGRNIPCITSSGRFCTFYLRLEDNGDFLVSFVLYELR